MISNYFKANSDLIAEKKAVFAKASLDSHSTGYDSPALIVSLSGVLAILATHAPFAAGIFGPAMLFAVTPISTILGLSEIGLREAKKLRASINELIEREPDKLSSDQLKRIADVINTTFVSPLYPLKVRLKKKDVAQLRAAIYNLSAPRSVNEINSLVKKLAPVSFSWEPANNDFMLRDQLQYQDQEIMRGRSERSQAKAIKKAGGKNCDL